MIQRFEIPGRFCSLNEYLGMDWRLRAEAKRDNDEIVAWSAKAARVQPCKKAADIRIIWVEENRKRDIDNVQFAVKFVLDGLVKAGVLKDDRPTYVKSITHEVYYDGSNPRIEVEIDG